MTAESKIQVKDILTPEVITITSDTTILKAAKMLAKNDIGAVIIKDNERIKGIFTERDLLKKVIAKDLDLNLPVAQVMTEDLVCLQLLDEFDKIPRLMLESNIRHLPVLHDFELVGIISIKDVMKYLVQK